jgi:hypothetical protein
LRTSTCRQPKCKSQQEWTGEETAEGEITFEDENDERRIVFASRSVEDTRKRSSSGSTQFGNSFVVESPNRSLSNEREREGSESARFEEGRERGGEERETHLLLDDLFRHVELSFGFLQQPVALIGVVLDTLSLSRELTSQDDEFILALVEAREESVSRGRGARSEERDD